MLLDMDFGIFRSLENDFSYKGPYIVWLHLYEMSQIGDL